MVSGNLQFARRVWEQIQEAPRGCAGCGCWLFVKRWLCSDCEQLLLHLVGAGPVSVVEPLGRIHRVWSWGEDGSEQVSSLLDSLKGCPPAWAMQPWSRVLAERIVTPVLAKRGTAGSWTVVPAPPRPPREFDHAHILARQVAENLGMAFYPKLTRPSAPPQRQLTKQERAGIRLSLCRGARAPKGQILFVDDVLTTGATAVAAWRALGEPNDFLIAVLAYRLRR